MRQLKYIILFILVSCGSNKATVTVRPDTVVVYKDRLIHDTVFLLKSGLVVHDTVRVLVQNNAGCEAFKKSRDSLYRKMLVYQYKVDRVKYYLKICLRNPKQDKWLKGWIKRAIE